MIEHSYVTGRDFDPDDACYYVNIVQSAFMIDNGAVLLDLFVRGDGKLVFVFSKDDHRRISPIWRVQKYGGDYS